jgi:DNA-binding transcriptional LysR family regulator
MEFRQLFTFKKIVELQSFTKAADNLGYSQPTVTSHIHALEKHLGVKLFDRIGRKIVLTDTGNQLIKYVSQITDIYTQIEDMAKDQDVTRGKIKIGAPETLTIYRLEPILREYQQTFPQVDIVLINDSNAPMYEKLKRGEIDIAFQIAADYEYKDYVAIHLAYESFVLVANADCKIDSLESNPDQLVNECVIYNAKGCIYRIVFEDYLKSKHIVPRNSIELWSIEAIKQGVINGLGISMLPLITVKKDIDEGRLKVVDLHLQSDSVSTQLIYHKNKWLSKSMRTWIEITKNHSRNWV